MAPFRAGRSTRSGRPGGQTEQDIVDGLPIRQWRQQDTAVGAAPEDTTGSNDVPIEGVGRWMLLPMPKGSESYTPWCQQLLRAARAGRIPIAAKRYRGLDKDDDSDGMANGTTNGREIGREKKIAKKEEPKGFTIKKWSQLPRNQEEPEIEYLAKRRKGLPSAMVTALAIEVSSGPMRKTKVKRMDAEGNVSIWDVLVPEGQTVEGEVDFDGAFNDEDAPVVTPLPGTVVEGIGVANSEGVLVATENTVAPIRRRGPPPRRKGKKGPGRGRKLPKMTESAGLGVSASAEAHAASTRQRMLAMSGDGEESGGSLANNTPAETNTGEEDEAEDEGADGDDGEEEDGDDEDVEEGEIEEDDEGGINRERSTTMPALKKVEHLRDDFTEPSYMEGSGNTENSTIRKASAPKTKAITRVDSNKHESNSPSIPIPATRIEIGDTHASNANPTALEDALMADADTEDMKTEEAVSEPCPVHVLAKLEQPESLRGGESEVEAKLVSIKEKEKVHAKDMEKGFQSLLQAPSINVDGPTSANLEKSLVYKAAPREELGEIPPKLMGVTEDKTSPASTEEPTSNTILEAVSADTPAGPRDGDS